MGLYYKNHRISGVNFLPRLTLSEYNNLTVKPEHWIRTDSPFDYSKTDVPKLTLAQYQDLAIKPKFWIRTDAPQSYTNISATQVDVTDSVSVKDYLDDLNATQVEYSSGVSVKQKIDEKADKQKITDITITNNQGGTETRKATLYVSGNIGILDFTYSCQNATSETITFGLPTGWNIQRGGIIIRDNNNGNLITGFCNPAKDFSTYNHIGTMTVGHMMYGTAMCYKTT